MREIKFRAWSGKRMLFMGLGGDCDFELAGGQVYEFGDFDWRVKDYPLMQLTGLQDKNGVDIYEGDVMKWDAQEWGGPFQEAVKWDFELLDARRNDWREWCEVIGNIHQNPELVGVK